MRKIIVALIVGTVATAGIAAAQQGGAGGAGGNSSNPSILAAIQSLRTDLTGSLNTLFQMLQSIQTSVSNLQPAAISNVRVTPPLFIGDNQSLACLVINASATPKHLKAELLRANGSVHSTFLSGNFALNPGESSGGSVAALASSYACKFTVLDGNRNDIRGTLEHFPAGNVIGTSLAAE